MNNINESCSSKTTVLHVVSDLARRLYYYVQWTGHFVCRKDFYINRKNFNSYLLLYTVKGDAVLNYGGRTYKISENSMMMIDCREQHEYYPLGSTWDFKYLHFTGNLSDMYYQYITELFGGNVFPATGGNIEYYLDELYRLTAESGAEETCSDYIYRILTKIIHGYRMTQELGSSPQWLNQAVEYITQNYQHEIQIEELAGMLHFSRCYFSTSFKKYTGFSPHQYIANYRLAEAKMMLFNTSLPIDSIAHACGFQNTSSFIRSFKNQEGVSPMVFRKSRSAGNPKV